MAPTFSRTTFPCHSGDPGRSPQQAKTLDMSSYFVSDASRNPQEAPVRTLPLGSSTLPKGLPQAWPGGHRRHLYPGPGLTQKARLGCGEDSPGQAPGSQAKGKCGGESNFQQKAPLPL